MLKRNRPNPKVHTVPTTKVIKPKTNMRLPGWLATVWSGITFGTGGGLKRGTGRGGAEIGRAHV